MIYLNVMHDVLTTKAVSFAGISAGCPYSGLKFSTGLEPRVECKCNKSENMQS